MYLISAWLHEALGNWQGWLSGGGVGGFVVIAIGLVERFTGRDMPKKWYAGLVLAGFFCGANFVAWSSAFQSMKGREYDLHQVELRAIKAEKSNVVLRTTLDEIAKTTVSEPRDSLRRRASKLANDIDDFILERDHHRRSGNGSDFAAYEPLRKIFAMSASEKHGSISSGN